MYLVAAAVVYTNYKFDWQCKQYPVADGCVTRCGFADYYIRSPINITTPCDAKHYLTHTNEIVPATYLYNDIILKFILTTVFVLIIATAMKVGNDLHRYNEMAKVKVE